MRRTLIILIIIAIGLFAYGCAVVSYTPLVQKDQLIAPNKFYITTGDVHRKYVELGIIEVLAVGISAIHDRFQTKAAEIRADAVIRVQFGYVERTPFGIGTAIRFTDSTETSSQKK
jgi:hypothetical protein